MPKISSFQGLLKALKAVFLVPIILFGCNPIVKNYASNEVTLGVYGDLSLRSDVFSISDLYYDNLEKGEFSYKKPFSQARVLTGLYAQNSGCRLAIENYRSGYANANLETLRSYARFEQDGLSINDGETIIVHYRFLTLEGNGASFGCKRQLQNHSIQFTGRWVNVHSFQSKRYQGVLKGDRVGIDAEIQEELFSTIPQLPDLQDVFESGRLISFDFEYQWQRDSIPLYGSIYIENALSRLDIWQGAYLTRDINAIIALPRIFQKGSVVPLVGSYGNKKLTRSLPRYWRTTAGWSIDEYFSVGLYATGIDASHQFGSFVEYQCSGGCNGWNPNFRVSIDERVNTVLLEAIGERVSVGVGVIASRGISKSAINTLTLKFNYPLN